MILEKRTRAQAGSCSFHDGAKWVSTQIPNTNLFEGGTVWDHEFVYEFCREANGGTKVRICQKCLEELFSKTMMESLTGE